MQRRRFMKIHSNKILDFYVKNSFFQSNNLIDLYIKILDESFIIKSDGSWIFNFRSSFSKKKIHLFYFLLYLRILKVWDIKILP